MKTLIRGVEMLERNDGKANEIEKIEQERELWVRRALMEAAVHGGTVHRPLMIGSTLVPEGITEDQIAQQHAQLVQDGYVSVEDSGTVTLSDTGFAEFMDLGLNHPFHTPRADTV